MIKWKAAEMKNSGDPLDFHKIITRTSIDDKWTLERREDNSSSEMLFKANLADRFGCGKSKIVAMTKCAASIEAYIQVCKQSRNELMALILDEIEHLSKESSCKKHNKKEEKRIEKILIKIMNKEISAIKHRISRKQLWN